MSQNIASLVTANGILLFIDGTQFTVGNDHINFSKIKDAIKARDYAGIPALADVTTSVRNWLGNEFELRGDMVHLDGVPFSAEITTKVLSMIEHGADADPLYAFLRKVRANPSKTAQDELLLFCVANGFMIHEDGDLIAYKSVRGNYTDIHSGKFNNAVGEIVTMLRHTVDDNRDHTCSTGLHFASYQYASTWAGQIDGTSRRLMVMKINPADVVSIPSDYNNEKGRCARYEVISEITSGERLPKREVYATEQLRDPQSRAEENDSIKALTARLAAEARARHEATNKAVTARIAASAAEERARTEATNKEITRKRTVISKYESELCELEDRAEQIRNLGGKMSTDHAERMAQLEDYIDKIECEIDDLQNRYMTRSQR